MNHYTFEEIKTGMEEQFSVTITEQMMQQFQEMTGDVNPLHCDDTFAKEKGFDGKVAYGMLTASFLSTMAGVYLPGENSLIQSVEVKFVKPVFPGEEITFTGKVSEVNDTFRFLVLKVTGTVTGEKENERYGTKVLKAVMQIGVR
ncbi:MAG: MaoC family dehydratase N-terminal domain-containing protein [Lachnospiraceae bacterium]|nr:MaoC family dehydratase N-terminal domain-containing protein [Lachnospiraceae bacterium]